MSIRGRRTVQAVVVTAVVAAFLPAVALPGSAAAPGQPFATVSRLPITLPYSPPGVVVSVTDVSTGAQPRIAMLLYVPDPGGQGFLGLEGAVYDEATGELLFPARASRSSTAPAFSEGLSLSADGRYAIFETQEPSLVTALPDGSHPTQVFVRDLTTWQLKTVSAAFGGGQGNSASVGGRLSADGRYATFTSLASNLSAAPVSDPVYRLYLRDLVSGESTRITPDAAAGSRNSTLAGIVTDDGGTVFYGLTTSAVPAVPQPPLSPARLMTYDRVTGVSSAVPGTSTLAFGAGAIGDASADGRWLVVNEDPYAPRLLDTATGDVTDVAVDGDGAPLPLPACGDPNEPARNRVSISPDGGLVAFMWEDCDLAAQQTSREARVFDRATGRTAVTPGSYPWLGSVGQAYVARGDGTDRADTVPRLTDGAAPARFVPLAPDRVAGPVPLGPGGSATVDLSSKVPAGATAVAVNVTLAGVTTRTYVSVCPTSTPLAVCKGTSTINPYAGRDVANQAFPRVGADRKLQLYNNEGNVLAYVDLVGYFATAATTGLDFTPLTRARDTEMLILGAAQSGAVTIDDVPAGATAVAIRVTAAGVTDNTYLSACPMSVTAVACAGTSTLNPKQRDTSNMAIVPISTTTGNQVRIYNNLGDALVYTDVTGFFVPAGQGSRYIATAPTRLLALQPIGPAAALTRTFPAIPAAATAVAANITVAGSTTTSYVSVCPGGTAAATCKLSSTVNPYAGQDTAAGTLTGLGTGPALIYYNNAGNGLLFTDVQGYFMAS